MVLSKGICFCDFERFRLIVFRRRVIRRFLVELVESMFFCRFFDFAFY